jgi:hypothetical protein
MKVYRGDIVSVFAILIGGAISGVATLRLLVPEPSPRTVSVRGERAAYRIAVQRGPASTQEMRALAERIFVLQNLQEEVRQRVAGFEAQGPAARADELAELRRVKDVMISELQDLQAGLDRASLDGDTPMSEGLGLAAVLVREVELLDKVRYSKGAIEQWDAQSANHLEQNIEADLLAVRERIVRSVGEPVRNRPVRRR